MKVANLLRKLEKTPEVTELKITATRAQWGGYNVRLYALVNGYYDLDATNQIRAETEEEAIEQFKASEIRSFHAKAWHDESDMMSDYFAGFFNERVKDVDWLVQSSKGYERKKVNA